MREIFYSFIFIFFTSNVQEITVTENMPKDYYAYIPSDTQTSLESVDNAVDNEFIKSLPS